MTELPPESVLRLARALGLEEFCSAMGWELARERNRIYVPVNDCFDQLKDLFSFCQKFEIPLNSVELNLGSSGKSLWDSMWTFRKGTDNRYPLFVDTI